MRVFYILPVICVKYLEQSNNLNNFAALMQNVETFEAHPVFYKVP